jgi:Cache domain
MDQRQASRRRTLRLSVRISFFLILAAILPLFIALIFSELQTRATLINQADRTLAADAQTHAQLIENYLAAKLLEVRTLDNTPIVQQYFEDPVHNQAALAVVLQNGLAINKSNDPDIVLVTHFDLQGHYLFHYSIYNLKPQPHGKYLIPPTDLQNLAKSKSLQYVSGVYYDPSKHQSTIDLYTTVYSTALHKPVGIIRSTLSLAYIWNIVNSEKGANGDGSYAFILDANGVRIIDPDPQTLFTSVAPLTSQLQQSIKDEQLYGKQSNIPVLAAPTFKGGLNLKNLPVTFSVTPPGKNEVFQASWRSFSTVPWTYFVLTPQNSIYFVANQQLFITLLVALLVLIPLGLLGWLVGSSIAHPISRSVESLQLSSSALSRLSENEKRIASEQIWMMDSSEMGLKSIQYYTDTSKKAVRQLNTLGNDLLARPEREKRAILNGVAQMLNIGRYFEQSISHQNERNRQVAVAMKTTREVAKQIESGAKSVENATTMLDQVVYQLRRIIGN